MLLLNQITFVGRNFLTQLFIKTYRITLKEESNSVCEIYLERKSGFTKEMHKMKAKNL